MQLEGRRVLVTGAAGFIGSHLCERLVQLGADVRAFIRYTSRGDRGMLEQLPAEQVRAIEIHAGDLKDPDAVRQAVRGREIVFHLGAIISIPSSYVNPFDHVQTNTVGTGNVLLAARQEGVGRVVHTSTSEVYGTARYAPIDEEHPLQAQSPYAASKSAADQLALSFYRSFDLPVTVVRPFNTFGPRQSARAVIPAIISQALNREYIELGSLHPTRDLLFVKDTVHGFLAAATSAATVGEVVNLGTGREVSIGELAELITGLVGRPLEIRTDLRRIRPEKSEVERLICDAGKAERLMGWRPQYSLEQGLDETIQWILQHPAFYRVAEYQV